MKQTITEIAAQAGISQGFLSNIICGRNRPHYKTAKNIAKVTNTDPILWLEGSPDELQQALSNNEETA